MSNFTLILLFILTPFTLFLAGAIFERGDVVYSMIIVAMNIPFMLTCWYRIKTDNVTKDGGERYER